MSREDDANMQDPNSALPGWAGAGGALANDAPPGPPPSDGDATTDEDRIAAIVAEVRDAHGGDGVERISDELTTRFQSAGLDVDASRTVALAAEVQAR